MLLSFYIYDNGKEGRIWPVDDADYTLKYTDWNNGIIRDEDWENSPIIASHFIGYCYENKPQGDGDIYTPFFTYYYKERLQRFTQKHIDDISLIRDSKRLEKQFLKEHIIEEMQKFEASRALSEYTRKVYIACVNLYYGYMAFLEEKWSWQFVFHQYTAPRAFSWREFDKISVDFQNTELYLDRAVELSLGRVFPVKDGGHLMTNEDKEQMKAVYGETCEMDNVFFIYFNTTDKKRVAEAVYDAFILDMEQRQFCNPTEKKLALEHAKRWISNIEDKTEHEKTIVTDIIKRQLKMCFEPISSTNRSDQKPFFTADYEPLEDNAELGTYDVNCFGYPAHERHRMNKQSFNDMMDAFNKWIFCPEGNTSESDLPTTGILESIFFNNHDVLQTFLRRIKAKKGAKIVDEVIALVGLDMIDKDETGESLRNELESLGYNTTSRQNWNSALNSHRDQQKIKEIQAVYKQ